MSINESARNALKVLLDAAEARNYDPPVPSTAVAELEWIIAATSHDAGDVSDSVTEE